MKRARVTLAGLMIVVAVVAVDLAAFILDARYLGGDWVRGLPRRRLPARSDFCRRPESRPVACILDRVRRLRLRDDGVVRVGLVFSMQESAVDDAWLSYGEFARTCTGGTFTRRRTWQWQ